MWRREEALYHVAVMYVDAGKSPLARQLLKRAAKDGDFPEAEAVLSHIRLKDRDRALSVSAIHQ